jgi:hypothetical protein
VAVCSEGGGVEVDGSSATITKSLRKKTAAARSEAGVEEVACSGVGDEAVVCSGAGIEDGRWRQRCSGF